MADELAKLRCDYPLWRIGRGKPRLRIPGDNWLMARRGEILCVADSVPALRDKIERTEEKVKRSK